MFWLQTAVQSATDTGIHITMSSAIVSLTAKVIYDEIRKKKNGNENGKDMRELVENSREQTRLLTKQNDILADMGKDIAIVLDRTERMK